MSARRSNKSREHRTLAIVLPALACARIVVYHAGFSLLATRLILEVVNLDAARSRAATLCPHVGDVVPARHLRVIAVQVAVQATPCRSRSAAWTMRSRCEGVYGRNFRRCHRLRTKRRCSGAIAMAFLPKIVVVSFNALASRESVDAIVAAIFLSWIERDALGAARGRSPIIERQPVVRRLLGAASKACSERECLPIQASMRRCHNTSAFW